MNLKSHLIGILNLINENKEILLYVNTLGIVSSLQELNIKLINLGIPASLRYGLIAEGSAISMALADGPLPFGDVVAIAVSIGVGFIIISN